MKFCIKCGNQLPDEAVFCDRCGQKTQAPQPAAEQAVQTIPPRDFKNEALIKRRPVLGVLMILAAVAIIFAAILFVASRI